MVLKPAGGRGKKAPYESTHVRCPHVLKKVVNVIIERWHEGLVEGRFRGDVEIGSIEDVMGQSMMSQDEAIALAEEILKGKKSARVSMTKLLTGIYKMPVEL